MYPCAYGGIQICPFCTPASGSCSEGPGHCRPMATHPGLVPRPSWAPGLSWAVCPPGPRILSRHTHPSRLSQLDGFGYWKSQAQTKLMGISVWYWPVGTQRSSSLVVPDTPWPVAPSPESPQEESRTDGGWESQRFCHSRIFNPYILTSKVEPVRMQLAVTSREYWKFLFWHLHLDSTSSLPQLQAQSCTTRLKVRRMRPMKAKTRLRRLVARLLQACWGIWVRILSWEAGTSGTLCSHWMASLGFYVWLPLHELISGHISPSSGAPGLCFCR